jgi:hypothetical protein
MHPDNGCIFYYACLTYNMTICCIYTDQITLLNSRNFDNRFHTSEK